MITDVSVKASRPVETHPGAPPAHREAEAIGFFQAFMLPNVMSYAVAFGFFKLVSTTTSDTTTTTILLLLPLLNIYYYKYY